MVHGCIKLELVQQRPQSDDLRHIEPKFSERICSTDNDNRTKYTEENHASPLFFVQESNEPHKGKQNLNITLLYKKLAFSSCSN